MGPARIELSGRYEHVATDNRALAVQRRFDPISVSAGLSYDWADGVRTALNLYRTERAPAAEELFSDGPHLATAAFEVGDPALAKEVARGGEASLRIEAESVSFTLTGFFTDYRDFIFEAFTGDEEDGLPVLAFAQASARFLGGEAEAAARLYDGPIWQVRADLAADIVRATNRAQDEPLPRIPPKSLLVGLGAFSNAVDARLDVELAASQNRIGARESATPGYAALHADLTWHPLGQAGGLRVILQGRNLTDSVMRRHTSFLKDILPLPGRSVRLAARLDF
ncbi:MAG: TonB-dependent receptor [Alphaproteobacteria bacterium]|nr:MAG: TonB-dependent receptor [Alphaproteobacteria bacterium]